MKLALTVMFSAMLAIILGTMIGLFNTSFGWAKHQDQTLQAQLKYFEMLYKQNDMLEQKLDKLINEFGPPQCEEPPSFKCQTARDDWFWNMMNKEERRDWDKQEESKLKELLDAKGYPPIPEVKVLTPNK